MPGAWRRPKIVGHRGAKAYEPENTLRSIRRALALGVQAVEIDIHLSRDGHLAVIHDATVDRTTNGQGRVAELDWAALRRLDAGQGERIPELAEVVEAVLGRAHLFIEVKAPEAAPVLLKFLRERQLFEAVTVISFWHPVIKALRQEEPRLQAGVLFVGCPVDPPALARAAAAQYLALNYQYVTPDLVQAARGAGLGLMVWNIDTVTELLPLLPLELDYIGSNAPDILLNYLANC